MTNTDTVDVDYVRQVDSSLVQEIAYDVTGPTLYVNLNGLVYTYDGVPAPVFNEFANSDSVGSYYSTHIKGHFPAGGFFGYADDFDYNERAAAPVVAANPVIGRGGNRFTVRYKQAQTVYVDTQITVEAESFNQALAYVQNDLDGDEQVLSVVNEGPVD